MVYKLKFPVKTVIFIHNNYILEHMSHFSYAGSSDKCTLYKDLHNKLSKHDRIYVTVRIMYNVC
jgi:hypothetical protein